MPRVHLSLDDSLYHALEVEAKEMKISISVYIISLLNKLKNPDAVDYAEILSKTIEEALSYSIDEEFTLVDLESFSEISMVQAVKGNIKPSMVRAGVGKMFNAEVRKGAIDEIKRVYKDGEPKFRDKAAVYVKVQ